MTDCMTPPTTEETRKQIKADLPEDTFVRQPQRALWFVPLVATAVAAGATIIVARPVWYVCLVLGLVMGQCFAAMGFLAHETLHGSIVKSKGLQYFLGYLGFGPMLVSPSLWRVWHNQVHHGKTNMGNSDPDSFGTVSRYEKAPSTRFVARLAPGSQHWSSAFFFAYWFMFHGQVVLWIQAKYMRTFARFDRRRAIIDSVVCLVLWIAVGVLAGPFYALFVVLVPIVVTNFLVMGYIATNHFMRPMTEANDPIENSMSVTTLPIIDKLHFNFSHHVEHHLFPMMSAKHAPRVRTWLEENEPERYVTPSHVRAFTYLYRTPRVYQDANTLVDPERPDEVHAEIRDVTAHLVH